MRLTVSAGEQHVLQQKILISNVLSFSVATFNLKVNKFYYDPFLTFCLPFMPRFICGAHTHCHCRSTYQRPTELASR